MKPVSQSIEDLLEQARFDAHQTAQVQVDVLAARLEAEQERCAALESQLADEAKSRKANDAILIEFKKILTDVQKKCDDMESGMSRKDNPREASETKLLQSIESIAESIRVMEAREQAREAKEVTQETRVEMKESIKIEIPALVVVRGADGKVERLVPRN